MTWMDSYARIHALNLSWIACEDDLTDWVDEALWPLASHADLGTLLWAMSAFVVITSRTSPAGVNPRVYRLACRIIADVIEEAIEAERKVAEGCP